MRNRTRVAHAVEDAAAAEEVPAATESGDATEERPAAADAGVALAAAEEPAAEEPVARATVASVDEAFPPLVEEEATVEELLVAQYCSRADSTPALLR
jgi:hypothetical protein